MRIGYGMGSENKNKNLSPTPNSHPFKTLLHDRTAMQLPSKTMYSG